jgi:hypothetical protein
VWPQLVRVCNAEHAAPAPAACPPVAERPDTPALGPAAQPGTLVGPAGSRARTCEQLRKAYEVSNGWHDTASREDAGNVLIATMPASNVVTAGRTYLDLITSNVPKAKAPEPPRVPKTKRERADENWKILVRLAAL